MTCSPTLFGGWGPTGLFLCPKSGHRGGVLTFGTDRPYPATGLTTCLWRTLETRWISFSQMITTQDGIHLEALLKGSVSYSGDAYPHIVYWQSRYYLEDGHHRVARLVLAGRQGAQCRIYESPEGDGQGAGVQDEALAVQNGHRIRELGVGPEQS
jgi:hypothetical protein